MLKRPILLFVSLLITVNLSLFFATQNVQSAHADIGGLVGLINQYRVSNGLGTLTEDAALTKAACWLAADMASSGNLDHIDSLERNFGSRLTDFGVTGGTRGENIASLTNQANSAQKVFDGWVASTGHKANMLTPAFTRIGVGDAYRSANKTYYWAADFASGNATGTVNGCSTGSNPPPAPPAANPPAKAPPVSPPPTPAANPPPAPEPAPVITPTPIATTPSLQKTSTITASTKASQRDSGNEVLILAGLVIVNLFMVIPIVLVSLL